MHRSFYRLGLSIFLTVAVAACQTIGDTGVIESSASVQLTPEAANAVATDMSEKLAEHIGPGDTTLQLSSDGSEFAIAFEASLREQGYAIATEQITDENTVSLAYVVDNFDDSILVRLSTERLDLTRMYQSGGEGAAAISPLSVMQRGASATS